MSGTSGQKRVLDHEEIFGEIVSELNESDDTVESSASEVAAAPRADTAPTASPALVPAVETSPAEADAEDKGESLPVADPPTEEETAAVSGSGDQASAAPTGDREVACWVDTTLSLVHRSATQAASKSPASSQPAVQPVESVDALPPGESPSGATSASQPDAEPPPTAEPPAGVEAPQETLAAEEPAESGESEIAEAPDTDDETARPEDERSGLSDKWRIFLVAILVGLLAGVLAAFLTTRLLHGSWLPRTSASVVSQAAEGHRTMVETFELEPYSVTAAESDVRQQLQSLSTSASGKAPAVSAGAL